MADRTELRTKVEQRKHELEMALKVTESQDHGEDRANALKADLRVAADAMQGGWDQVSEAGAASLSRWLESTHQMIIPPKTPAPKAKAPAPKA